MGRPALNLIGQRFGKLIVIRQIQHSAANKRAKWQCLCDCGNYSEVYSHNLRNKIRSCGCEQHIYEDIVGQRFGKLVVMGKTNKRWQCLCDCGNQTTAEITPLKQGRHLSCGCYSPIRWKDNSSNKLTALKSYQDGAKKRQLEWQLTDDEFYVLAEGQCHYCGRVGGNIRIKKDSRAPAYEYTGVDRLDSSTGYIKTNCVSCCKICNHAKKNMPYDKFQQWIVELVTYQTSLP